MPTDEIMTYNQNLDELEVLAMQAKRVPLSNMCMVERDKLTTLVSALTTAAPGVFKECKGVVENQLHILKEATDQAEQTKQGALARASQYVGDAQAQAQKTIQAANQQAQEAMAKAQQQATAMVQEAQEQAQNRLKDAEKRSAQLVSQQEVVARANMEAEELRQSTKEEVERLYGDVYHHIDEVLAQLDRTISEKLMDIRVTRQQLDQSMR